MNAAERGRALESCPLFAGLPKEALAHLAETAVVRRVRKGEAIIREGETGDSLQVIVDGRVRAEKRTPSGDLWTVRLQETGDVFGELALLDCTRRSASVVAEADCTLLVIERERFLSFGDCYPAAGLAVTRRLAQRLAAGLRRATDDVVTLFSARVNEVERRL